MNVLRTPIIIFSFDRPDYLGRLCRGLLAQRHVVPDPAMVHLVQDGAVSARTGRRHGDPATLARSIDVFRRYFPQGGVHAAPTNLGIADNILRGQRLAFETLDVELAYFFEDDLEPGPLYLRSLEALRGFTEPFADRVAYFATYGDHHWGAHGPAVRYVLLNHHWGFGLRRAAWRRIVAWTEPWRAIIRQKDYQDHDVLAVLRYWETLPIASPGITQDTACAMACVALDLARINTDVCFAEYIGKQGQHSSPAEWRRLGFDRMRAAVDDACELPPLDEATLESILGVIRTHAQDFRRLHLPKLIADTEAAQARRTP